MKLSQRLALVAATLSSMISLFGVVTANVNAATPNNQYPCQNLRSVPDETGRGFWLELKPGEYQFKNTSNKQPSLVRRDVVLETKAGLSKWVPEGTEIIGPDETTAPFLVAIMRNQFRGPLTTIGVEEINVSGENTVQINVPQSDSREKVLIHLFSRMDMQSCTSNR